MHTLIVAALAIAALYSFGAYLFAAWTMFDLNRNGALNARRAEELAEWSFQLALCGIIAAGFLGLILKPVASYTTVSPASWDGVQTWEPNGVPTGALPQWHTGDAAAASWRHSLQNKSMRPDPWRSGSLPVTRKMATEQQVNLPALRASQGTIQRG